MLNWNNLKSEVSLLSATLYEPIEINSEIYIPTLEGIARITRLDFNIPEKGFHGKTRKSNVVFARQLYFSLARAISDKYNCSWSLSDIGYVVNKDHSTVLHGLREINNAIETKYKINVIADAARCFDLELNELIYIGKWNWKSKEK